MDQIYVLERLFWWTYRRDTEGFYYLGGRKWGSNLGNANHGQI